MNIETFEFISKTENKARLYFRKYCWQKDRVFCARCKSRKIYRIIGRRYRCKKCGYTFHDFTNRWINRVRIPYKKWLWIIKFFELEISARRIAEQTALSYPTVLKACHLIRMAIVNQTESWSNWLKGEVEIDESYFGGKRKGKRGRGAAGKVPVFGILERNGVVKVEILKDVTATSLLNLTVQTVRRGSIIYTDKFKGYDSLMFCGYRHLRVDHGKRFAKGKVYINGLEGFWSYSKERLAKYHGVSKEHFPFYLKELEFRYNNRTNNIFKIITQNIVKFVPDLL